MYYSLKVLKAYKLKTILIFTSLSFCVIAIFLITSISNGVIKMYSNILKSDGDIIVTQANISDTFFSNVDIAYLEKIKELKYVKDTSAMIVGASPVESLPIVAIYGVSENRYSNYKLVSGEYPKNKNEVIVGKRIADTLNTNKTIKIASKEYKVSGIFDSEIGFENGGIVIPLVLASELFNKSSSMILVNLDDLSKKDDVVEDINELGVDIEAKSTNEFVNNYNQFKIIQKSSLLISILAFMMGLLSIASIMSITINERKEEFGIKKAIGISSFKIATSIAFEGLILSVASFVCAFFISNILLEIIKQIETFQGYVSGDISSSLALYVFASTIIMTILGSIVPIIMALKYEPVMLIQGNTK